jgi:hypothetical protein
MTMRTSKRKIETMTEIGKLGGDVTLERYGTSYFSALSKKRKSFKGGRKPKKTVKK